MYKNPSSTGFLQFAVPICFTLEIKLQMSLVTPVSPVALCLTVFENPLFLTHMQVCTMPVSMHSEVRSGCEYKFQAIEHEQCKEHNPCCTTVSICKI